MENPVIMVTTELMTALNLSQNNTTLEKQLASVEDTEITIKTAVFVLLCIIIGAIVTCTFIISCQHSFYDFDFSWTDWRSITYVINSTTSDGDRLPCPNNGDKQQNTKLMDEMEQAENAACFVSIV